MRYETSCFEIPYNISASGFRRHIGIWREYRHSLTFRVRRYVVIATTANPPNSAQLEGTLPFPQLTSGSVQQCGNVARDSQTDTDGRKQCVFHFASAIRLTRNVIKNNHNIDGPGSRINSLIIVELPAYS